MAHMDGEGNDREPAISAEAILAAMDAPVFVLDQAEGVLNANPAAARVVDRSVDDVVGKRWAALVPPTAKPADSDVRCLESDSQRVSTGDPTSFARSVLDRDGHEHRFCWRDSAGPDDTLIRVGIPLDVEPESDDDRPLGELEQRVREAEKLRQASSVVFQSLDLSEAIQRMLEQLAHVIPYDSASVQLLRDGELDIVGGRGWTNSADVIGMRFPIPGDNPNTEIVQKRAPVVLDNAPEAYTEFHRPPHDHIRSFMGVPLISMTASSACSSSTARGRATSRTIMSASPRPLPTRSPSPSRTPVSMRTSNSCR